MTISYGWRGDFTNAELNELVAVAVAEARAAVCEWLHADFDDDLRPFYFAGCGFIPTNAGLIAS